MCSTGTKQETGRVCACLASAGSGEVSCAAVMPSLPSVHNVTAVHEGAWCSHGFIGKWQVADDGADTVCMLQKIDRVQSRTYGHRPPAACRCLDDRAGITPASSGQGRAPVRYRLRGYVRGLHGEIWGSYVRCAVAVCFWDGQNPQQKTMRPFSC